MNFENSDPERMGFSRLYVEHRLRFVRFANSYVHDWAVSEDIVTDALLQYWESRAELPSDSNIPAYILTIVRNRCLNHLRHVVVRDTYSHDMKEYYEWDLNTRISTLEACDPSDIYTDEVRSLVARQDASCHTRNIPVEPCGGQDFQGDSRAERTQCEGCGVSHQQGLEGDA